MGQKRSPLDEELYHRVDEVLHYIWDPIGIAGTPGSRDEYSGYLPQVYAILMESLNGKDVETYLLSVETERMGLSVDAASRQRVEHATAMLVNWREWQKAR